MGSHYWLPVPRLLDKASNEQTNELRVTYYSLFDQSFVSVVIFTCNQRENRAFSH